MGGAFSTNRCELFGDPSSGTGFFVNELGGCELAKLSTGGNTPMRLRGLAKSIGPGGGLLYAFTGLYGVGSSREGIEEGGGGGVDCLLESLLGFDGEEGGDFVLVNSDPISDISVAVSGTT